MHHAEIATDALLGPLNQRETINAPPVLYLAGDESLLRSGHRVAVIGSRNASPAGMARSSRLAKLLASRQIIVLSGLASGIDTAAHAAAIVAHGRTIAVIGTPLDQTYPVRNAALQRTIARDHLLVSQFPVGASVDKTNFLQRNRTMALLADATVIVEAESRSGCISMANETLRLGRPLFFLRSLVELKHAWVDDMLHRGATVLSNETTHRLFEALPGRVGAG
jgi:DNA processing protein